MKSGNAVQRAIVVLRSEGLESFWFKLLGEIGYRRLLLLERSLTQPISELMPELPVRIDMLKENEVRDYLAFRLRPGVRIMEALQSGQKCLWRVTRAACIGRWIAAAGRIGYLGCELELAANEAYLFDAFSIPAYRGQGIAPALCLTAIATPSSGWIWPGYPGHRA